MPRTELPDRPARLRIEPGCQLIEKHDFGIVDQRERDEESLLLSPRQRHEPRVALFGEPELFEQSIAVGWFSSVERGPEVDCFFDLDALLSCASWSWTPMRC